MLEYAKDMLVGNILAVPRSEVWLTGGVDLALGLFHYVFRRRLLDISADPKSAASVRPASSCA